MYIMKVNCTLHSAMRHLLQRRLEVGMDLSVIYRP